MANAILLNPGPGWGGNYIQPDYRVPLAPVAVNIQPGDRKGNPLNVTWPIPAPPDPVGPDYGLPGGRPFPRGVQPSFFNVSG